MKQRLFCRDKVMRLLQALLQESDPGRLATIVKQEPFPPRVGLPPVLGNRLSTLYYAALNQLGRELVPQHAPRDDLAQAFWELFGEVAADPTGYGIRGRLTKRLDKFVVAWKRPLNLYEVAYKISNLNLGTQSFSFGNVTFFTMDDTKLTQWGISKDDTYRSHLYGYFSGQPVALIQVEAADSKRAFETGLQELFFGLDLLRLAAVKGRNFSFVDLMFLWEFDGNWMARQISPPDQYLSGWGSGQTFRPLIIDMAEHIRKGLEP